MPSALFRLSAFGDEIADDLTQQLRVLNSLQIGHLELRAAWGRNVLSFTDDEVAAAKRACAAHRIRVSCIASPVGKVPIADPFDGQKRQLARALHLAETFGMPLVRVFSYYPPDPARAADFMHEATDRLGQLTALAATAGCTLLLEPEWDLVAGTPERVHHILRAVNSPHLQLAWDCANLVRAGFTRPVDAAWDALGPYVRHVHIKDYQYDEGVRLAGEGQGQIADVLARLRAAGYDGFLALEPHLLEARATGGFSGPDGMARAAAALRRLLQHAGCIEQLPG